MTPSEKPINLIRHKDCGQPVSVALLNDDMAIYVFCDTCNDIVEAGELLINEDRMNHIRLILVEPS